MIVLLSMLAVVAISAILPAVPVTPPPLTASLQADNTLAGLAPDGWTVADVERTAAGLRFYRVVEGRIEWADYPLPLTVRVGDSPLPPTPAALAIVTATLQGGAVGESYAQTLQAAGGTPPYAWSVSGAGPPDGLSLNSSGVLSGTPGKAGKFSLVIILEDGKLGKAEKTLVLAITETPVPPPPPPPPPVPSKLRVLLSTPEAAAMMEAQRQIVSSTKPGGFRAFCQDHCLTDPVGGLQLRIWPPGVLVSDVSDSWKPLVTAAGGRPGLTVQSGEGGLVTRVDFPPDNAAAVQALERIAKPRGPPHVITEENYREVLNWRGRGKGFIKPPASSGLPRLSAVVQLVPRSQWAGLIAEGRGTFLSDLLKAARIPCLDQNGTNYCWAYASTGTVRTIRLLQGQPFVELSAESVGGPVKNWRNVGGWGYEALAQLKTYGACEASFMDRPNSLSPSRWKKGWEDNALLHRITAEWAEIDDDGFDGVMTAVFYRMPVSIGLDWWGHQVEVLDPVDLGGGKYGVYFRNSWGADYGEDGYDTLSESRAKPSGSFACVSVGTSDRDQNARTRGTPADLVRLRSASVKKAILAARETNYQTAP